MVLKPSVQVAMSGGNLQRQSASPLPHDIIDLIEDEDEVPGVVPAAFWAFPFGSVLPHDCLCVTLRCSNEYRRGFVRIPVILSRHEELATIVRTFAMRLGVSWVDATAVLVQDGAENPLDVLHTAAELGWASSFEPLVHVGFRRMDLYAWWLAFTAHELELLAPMNLYRTVVPCGMSLGEALDALDAELEQEGVSMPAGSSGAEGNVGQLG